MSYIGRGIDQIDNISTLDNLSFNGSSTTFNLTQNSVAFVPVSADALQIQIDGIIQSGNYSISGSTVTFNFTPSGSSVCNGIKHFGVGVLTQPSDGSVNIAQLGASGTKDATTFLRGDNTFASAGTDLDPGSGEVVVNDSSADVDFRVESNAETDMIFADGGLSAVGINCSPNVKASNGGGDLSTSVYSLQVSGASGATGKVAIGSNGSANGYIGYSHVNSGGSNIVTSRIEGQMDSTTAGSEQGSLEFYTMTGGSITEKMRITSGGNVGIANTSPSAALEVSPTSSEGVIYATGNSQSNELIRWNNTNTSSTNHTISFFKRNGATTGSIAHTNNSTSFNTSSDYRLKENEVALSDGIIRLKTLKPYRFNFKTDADKTVDGFFAHEVSSVVPEAISGEKDAVDSEGNIEPQAIDQSKLVPLLTSALQEAITKIETLEARVQTLENA